MKSEPGVYSIADLKRDRTTIWDGVRNYQARNYLRQMQVEDLAFFYHSNATPPGIVGLMRVVVSGVIDPSQFNSTSPYYDPKSEPQSPRWHTVQVEFVKTFPLISLTTLKQEFSSEELGVVRQGNRLSVMPVSDAIAQRILAFGHSLGSGEWGVGSDN